MKPNIAIPAPLIALLAIFLGSVMDAVIKLITQEHALITVVFWRFVVGAVLITVPFFLLGRRLPGWQATRFHAFRGAVQVSAALTFFYSLSKLSLAEATTIGFSAALMVAPFERLILGEKIHPRAALAAIIGFVGVVIAVSGHPLGGSPDRILGVCAALFAAAAYALTLVLLRARAAIDGGFVIAVYANVFPAIYMLIPALLVGIIPPVEMLPVFVGIGVLGSTVWIIMTYAYARAKAQQLAPLEYSALVWSAVLGWALFNEVPPWQLWMGAVVIIGACFLVMFDGPIIGSRTRARSSVPILPDKVDDDNS